MPMYVHMSLKNIQTKENNSSCFESKVYNNHKIRIKTLRLRGQYICRYIHMYVCIHRRIEKQEHFLN